MIDSDKILNRIMFYQQENGIKHSPYEKEFEFYEYVKLGNIEKVKEILMSTPLCGPGTGILSVNKVHNAQYHSIISVALITRFCVEGGMEMEIAFTLSDYYIMKIDNCKTCKEVHNIHIEMVHDFTKRMKNIVKDKFYSKHVVMCFDYIYSHLHEKISVKKIADYIKLSSPYLSKLFHNEVGITLNAYIMTKRIELAKNMLRYSDYSTLDIANYFAFSSHSHFISVFKKYTSITPKEYRTKHYRADWTSNTKHENNK